jgi:uncharacterized secreted protein with C-terminal beta-propeller domain
LLFKAAVVAVTCDNTANDLISRIVNNDDRRERGHTTIELVARKDTTDEVKNLLSTFASISVRKPTKKNLVMMMNKNEVSAVVPPPEAGPSENDEENAIAVPGPPEQNPPHRTLPTRPMLLGLVLVITAILCISLPLTLRDDDNDDDVHDERDQSALQKQDQAVTTNSSTADDLSDVDAATTSGPDGLTVHGTVDMPSNETMSDELPNGEEEEEQDLLVSTSASESPFSSSMLVMDLPLFGQGIISGYTDAAELEAALVIAYTKAARNYIRRQKKIEQDPYWPWENWNDMSTGMATMASTEVPVEDYETNAEAPGEDQGAMIGELTDYQTNIQEAKVDEADIIKADANFVYAAYGDYILVWDAFNGTVVAQVQMIEPKRYKPQIETMLLTEHHLIAILNMYPCYSESKTRTLFGYKSSQVRVYDKNISATSAEAGTLPLVGKRFFHGCFVDARSVGDSVYIATNAEVDLYKYLWDPLDRSNFGENATDEEYRQQAMDLAQDTLIPYLTHSLTQELQDEQGNLPNMLKVNQWMTHAFDNLIETGAEDEEEDDSLRGPRDYHVASNVAQIISFNANNVLNDSAHSGTSLGVRFARSAYFSPTSLNIMYGTQDKIVVTSAGWDWMPSREELESTTYVVALEIFNGVTYFSSVGTLKGHLLNPYSLDIVGNELRAATTLERPWWSMDGTNDGSTTENYMIVLYLVSSVLSPSASTMMLEKGRVQIGEKHERITAVRFFDNIAYAVTFRRTDPFYVLDMSVPQVLGELKLPGFSNYLHSMNNDNTWLVAIGQNATSEGFSTGLMVTVFNASDPTNPQATATYGFIDHNNGDNDFGGWSESDIRWDYKAFRYLQRAGKLIMPVDIWYHGEDPAEHDEFHGFAVLDVTKTSITEQYRISHAREPGRCDYCHGEPFPTRSFVYRGDLMTVRDITAVSTDLATGEEVWRMNVTVDGEPDYCGCGYFFFR